LSCVFVAADIRYAVRALLARPAFAGVAIGTLALGIGATVAVFSIVDGVLLRPLALATPERLVVIWETHPSLRVPFMAASPPHVDEWRAEKTLFEEVGGFAAAQMTVGGAGIAEQLNDGERSASTRTTPSGGKTEGRRQRLASRVCSLTRAFPRRARVRRPLPPAWGSRYR
jgi:hypothetical protein